MKQQTRFIIMTRHSTAPSSEPDENVLFNYQERMEYDSDNRLLRRQRYNADGEPVSVINYSYRMPEQQKEESIISRTESF